MQKRFVPLALFLLFVSGMALIQFAAPDMPDNDGFYHIKLAWLMRTEGLKPDFPYLPLSILNEREFYDHHFLFHVALIPFTFGDLRMGAKWAAVAFASLAFLAVWYLFRRQRVPFAWLWALGLLGISDAFLYRMSITRAQSLSLGMLALACAWLLEGKPVYCFRGSQYETLDGQRVQLARCPDCGGMGIRSDEFTVESDCIRCTSCGHEFDARLEMMET